MISNDVTVPADPPQVVRKGGVLVAINTQETAQFLPAGISAAALGQGVQLSQVCTQDMTPAQWLKLLRQLQPTVIVSAWSTPRLPEELCAEVASFLRYVCNLTGTVRHVVPRNYLEAGVCVTNWGDSISRSVAECALMHILCGLRRTVGITLALHVERRWNEGDCASDLLAQGEGLFEKKVGIHGFGNVARKLVELLQPFAVQISSYAPGVPHEHFTQLGVERVESLDALFADNDVVVELEAAVPSYYKMVDERVLRLLKPGAVFVNLGRGFLVDEAALARIAVEGNIQIGLDVYEQEPLARDAVFRGLPNVLLTPHIGGPTVDRRVDAGKVALQNLQNFFAGRPLMQEVTLEVYDRMT